MNSYVRTKNSLSLVVNGELVAINKDHPSYQRILEELDSSDINWNRIQELLNVKAALINYIGNNLRITDNVFTYKWRGEWKPLVNVLVDKILEGWQEDRDSSAFIKFLDNLTKNPLKNAIDELYLFLEANELPITDDGYFLAYKRVNSEFKDYHTGTFDNSVGKTVSMPRKDVEFNREVTCSTGLHFCSKEYLSSFGNSNDPIIVVKIHPKDVVSIPSDYNNAKGRCCRYEVIGVLKNEEDPLKPFAIKKQEKSRKVEEKNLKTSNTVNLEKKEGINPNIKVYSTVEEARKFHKPRVVNDTLYVYNKKKNVYYLYQFIGGTSNSHLKRIRAIESC